MKTSILLLALCAPAFSATAQNAVSEAEASASIHALTLDGSASTETDPAAVYTKGVDPTTIRSEEGLVIWPIPAHDQLNIFCSSGTSGNLPFEIVDMTGRTIVRGSIQGETANIIEIDNLKKGDHLLRVVDGSGVRSIAFQSLGE